MTIRGWAAFVVAALLGSGCLQPVADVVAAHDAGVSCGTDAGAVVDAGRVCGITISGAATGSLPCPFVQWQDYGDGLSFSVNVEGGSGKLMSLFATPTKGHAVGALSPGNEILGGSAFFIRPGPAQQPFYGWNVWNPPAPDAGIHDGEVGGGEADLWLDDAGVRGWFRLRFAEYDEGQLAPDGGFVDVEIVLPQ